MDFFYKRKINYYETDKMGIVHHSNYVRFLEEARSYWLESIGIPMGELESRGYTIPTLEVHIKYKHHVTCGDVITIRPAVTEYNGCRITVCYEVKSGESTVIEAYTRHCFTTSNLKPINIKKHDMEIYQKFEDLHNLAKNSEELWTKFAQ
ncbi:MAG: acyl-CoA thioesterase [Firmicutes bacterium]|nr:acyl-CoA thioesterase [Bacillota bacterium]